MIRSVRPRLLLSALLGAALSVSLLAGCGEKDEDETAVTARDRVTLVLDYFPNADHAAIYAALGSGAFERAGLDVEIKAPGDAATPLKVLESGRADFVITYQPELLLARDKGLKAMSVGALVREPLTSLISLEREPIRRPADLKDKTVGTAGIAYQAAYLDTILRGANVDPESVRRVDLGFNLSQPLIAGRVDATLGAFWNYEGVELERKGRRPVIRKMTDLGVPTYHELLLAATEETVRNRGPVVRRFVQAISVSASRLRNDADLGLDPLMAAAPTLDRGLQEAVLKVTLPVMFPVNEERPFGWIEEREWAAYARWMQEQGLITSAQSAGARAYTNEFLAGEGVGEDDGA